MAELPRPPVPYDFMPVVPTFELWSTDIADGQQLGSGQLLNARGLSGDNLSPDLQWSGHPLATKSFGVTCLDIDALTGSGFWHWNVFNIPAALTRLPTGAGSGAKRGLPDSAVHVRNDFGTRDYCGAAPPAGRPPNRYVFAVHALDIETLEPDEDASPAVAGSYLRVHTIARAVMIPVYQRV